MVIIIMDKINDIKKEQNAIEIARKSIIEAKQILVIDANKLTVREYYNLCEFLASKKFEFDKYMNGKVYFIRKIKNKNIY
ncbi:MAG: hypothetical protein QXW62_06640 [Candidatus Methanomethylicaceae archaeon]